MKIKSTAIAYTILFLLILVCPFVQNKALGQQQVNFKRLDRIFNLTSNVAVDAMGYMWISDLDGLYKYDGYAFTKLPFSKVFGSAFQNNSDVIFKKDGKGNFWVANGYGGLSKITVDGEIEQYHSLLKGKVVTAIAGVGDRVWFGTAEGDLFCYDLLQHQLIKQLFLPAKNSNPSAIIDLVTAPNGAVYISTRNNQIYSYQATSQHLQTITLPSNTEPDDRMFLALDDMNRLWISTEFRGLLCYNPADKTIKQYGQREEGEKQFVMYRTIFCDSQGILWLGTDGHGIQRLDPKTGRITAFKHQFSNIFSISNNTVRHIGQDQHGNIWVVVKGGIVHVLPQHHQGITTISGLPGDIPYRVLSVLQARDQSIWIGTDGEGLSQLMPNGKRIHYHPTRAGSVYFKGRFIQSMAEDSVGNIWLGTYQSGLFRYDHHTKQFSAIDLESLLGYASVKDVRHVFVDTQDRVWISSTHGIHVLRQDGKLLATFEYGKKGLVGSISECVYQDHNGTIWIALKGCKLYRFSEPNGNMQQAAFVSVPYHEQGRYNLGRYNISQILDDQKGNLWLRCEAGFLVRYQLADGKTVSYEKHEKLKNIEIVSLMTGNKGTLWLGSRAGLHKFDPQLGTLNSFYENDGLQGDLFIKRSVAKSRSGQLFFGGVHGISAFFPQVMSTVPVASTLYINHIHVLNRPLEEISNDRLSNRVEQLKELTLDADHSSFSLGFAAIGNLLNANYSYKYKLSGFDDQWTVANNGRSATYTNMQAGDYIFEVIAAHPGASDYDIGPTRLYIHIKSFWWQTWWALSLYAVVFVFMLLAISRWFKMRRKLIAEETVYRQEKQLYAAKMNLFATISHEIRTPLSLILGPLDTLLSTEADPLPHKRKQLRLIKNNAVRLSHIVDELTLVRDKELGRHKLDLQLGDIFQHLQQLAYSFQELASRKQITFFSIIPEEPYFYAYDRLQLEHVLYNLLTNALKFTSPHGQVTLRATIDHLKQELVIVVADNGIGISAQDQEKVFQLFCQTEEGIRRGGLGIGLALSLEIVTLHQGRLRLESALGEGAQFEIYLPIHEKYILAQETSVGIKEEREEDDLILPDEFEPKSLHHDFILVVEDNLDMQEFLKDLLGVRYRVACVDSGEAALDFIASQMPDLIVSDVMMSGMNGFSLAKKLKEDRDSASVPVILLTASATADARLRGLQSGAISFMNKPFHPKELLFMIDNLLKQHASIRDQLQQKIKTMPLSGTDQKSKSDTFLELLTQTLKDKANDPDFHLEELALLLSMSYSVIFRKCQALTGKTPSEYFKIIRLKQGAFLMVKLGYNISEAAYEVGYSDNKYFSRIFKESFRISPSEFKAQVKAEELQDFLGRY